MNSREDALVGYTGFVGSNLIRQHHFHARYNSKNIDAIEGRQYSDLVFAGAQSKKWWANVNPDEDWSQIERALNSLSSVKAERVVLISTIDVVPKTSGVDEDVECVETDSYGKHRLQLEKSFAELFEKMTIVRLPGLFGQGLKKNVIYDLLNDNQIDKINPESIFQYYSLENIWRDIERVRQAGIRLVHFATQPIKTKEILDRFFPDAVVSKTVSSAIAYDFRTKHSGLFGRSDGYILGKEQVFEQLENFIVNYTRGIT